MSNATSTVTQLAGLAFKGISAARARIDANYERAGSYWQVITSIKLDKSRKSEVFFAIEKTVVRVLDERIADQPPGKKGHPVGESICHMMMAKHDSFLGNVKAFIANTMGLDAADITEEHASQVCDSSQPLTGTVVEVESRSTTTRAGNPFTAINYRREVPPEEVLAYLSSLPPDQQAIKDRLFPKNYLENVVAAMNAQTAPPSA